MILWAIFKGEGLHSNVNFNGIFILLHSGIFYYFLGKFFIEIVLYSFEKNVVLVNLKYLFDYNLFEMLDYYLG